MRDSATLWTHAYNGHLIDAVIDVVLFTLLLLVFVNENRKSERTCDFRINPLATALDARFSALPTQCFWGTAQR